MSFYVVFRGRVPGIYDNWPDCEKQVKGFSNASFKKYSNIDVAKEAYQEDRPITTTYPKEGLAVDAAFSMKKDEGEFQIYDLTLDEIVYRSRIYKGVTVNIMEFLAIVLGLKYNDESYIYSDSATAITWIKNKAINSNAKLDPLTQVEIDEALEFLKKQDIVDRIIKWDTGTFGEIKADFGRK